jgi:PAS domain S-box-containing protein
MATSSRIFERDIYRFIVEQTKDYAVFALNVDGVVMTWNVGAERLKGYRPDEIVGQHFRKFYAPEDIARGWPDRELQMAAAEGRFEDEGWRVRKDGSRFWANVIITALRDDFGRLVGFSKFTRDLTGRRMYEEALRQSEERFRLLVESVTDYAIYMLDIDGAITSWNSGAQRITGYTRDEIIGAHFSRFYTSDARGSMPWQELATARRLGRAETEGWRIKKNGERFWARIILTALYEQENRLRGFAQIIQDLSDRRHIQSLEQAARNVGDFIAVLAHELRNPLAPIRNAAQLMMRLPSDHPDQQTMRAMIERQSGQLTRIVDDILDMARITKGVLSIERESVDLDRVIQAAVESVQPQIAEQQHTLAIENDVRTPPIQGDAHRLTQVLVNLLSNAVRYTPSGGTILLRVTRDTGYAFVTVKDNGRGIEPELQDRIFDMFVRGREARVASNSGLGVGLALSRKIAELHGGSLEVRSEGKDRGAEFTLKLPIARVTLAESRGKPPPPPRTPAQRILLVDDNKDAAAALELMLKELGHRTIVAHGGVEALEKLSACDPDCVFLDLGMPGMDGYEVARRIRASGLARQPRLIALTGWGQEDDRRQTRAAGFDEHLVKPVNTDDIMKALAHVPFEPTERAPSA